MTRLPVSTAVLSLGYALGFAFGFVAWAPTPAWAAPAAPASGPATLGAPGKPAGGGGAAGPSRPAAATLPPPRPVDVILSDVAAAIGGAAALGRHRSLHTKMEITFKGLGITGSAEHYAAVGDKALTVTSIPNLASTREGSDGTRVWSEDPINGLRILEGTEAEQARIEVAWNAELRMKELFAKIEAKNELGDDGARLECLILTPRTGPAMTSCFDPRTHLLVLQRGVRSGPQGEMPFTARLSDWRPVGDLKMAFATDMQVGPLAFTGRVTSVEMDVAIDPGLFALPSAPKTGAKASTKASAKTGMATDKGAPPRTQKKVEANKPPSPPPAPPTSPPPAPKR